MPDDVKMLPSDAPHAVLIAVPDDVIDELVDAGLVDDMPTLRGPVLDAVITVGVDSAALVTLMQTPATVRAFAAWLSVWVRQRRDSVTVTGTRGGRSIRLQVDGDVPVEAVASFLMSALGHTPDAEPDHAGSTLPPREPK